VVDLPSMREVGPGDTLFALTVSDTDPPDDDEVTSPDHQFFICPSCQALDVNGCPLCEGLGVIDRETMRMWKHQDDLQ
jgi:hypothetical protein